MWKSAIPLLLLASSACSDMCKNDVRRVVNAPDGKHAAVLFQRDCGATTDFSTQVSLVKTGDGPSGGGNVFIADSDHGAAGRAAWGGPWADLTWLSPQHLLVRYDARSRVFKENGNVSGARVTFEKVAR